MVYHLNRISNQKRVSTFMYQVDSLKKLFKAPCVYYAKLVCVSGAKCKFVCVCYLVDHTWMMGNLTIFMRQFKMKRVLAPFSKAKGGKTDDVCRGSLITKQALVCSLPLILSSWIINFYLEIFTFFSFDVHSLENLREQTYTSSSLDVCFKLSSADSV